MSLIVSPPLDVPCESPRDCGRLHCAVCTAHLANPQQRFCSARCRSRARSLRKQRLACPRCGAEFWLRRREGTTLVVPKTNGKKAGL